MLSSQFIAVAACIFSKAHRQRLYTHKVKGAISYCVTETVACREKSEIQVISAQRYSQGGFTLKAPHWRSCTVSHRYSAGVDSAKVAVNCVARGCVCVCLFHTP